MIRPTVTSRACPLGMLLRFCSLAGLFAYGLVAYAAVVKFNIPAQPASSALQVFAKQSGMEVLFPFDELKKVPAKEVKSEMEPTEALKKLLDGTGYVATQTAAKNFVVKQAEAPVTTGSIKGSLVGEGARGLANVLVTVRETAQSAETDNRGEYVFPKMAAGTYVLVANAPGYQPLHIVDVTVKAGRELTLGKEELRRAREGVLALEPLVVHADAVTELDKFEVTGTKLQPFTSGNVDIPRTINDAQPYYIFDSKAIDRSGATNVNDFLKQRLTMNTVDISNSQYAGNSTRGNTSLINLRGLGADKTLILVNGRRMAGVNFSGTVQQPDLNGIPLSAIDRIEVLPSSASGIYGGSAIGGVVNVILKKDYAGGEIRATYDNTWDSDSPTRTVSASMGIALEGGKTHVRLSASWSDASPLLLQDRREIYERNIATITSNAPAFNTAGATTPPLGALPNILNLSGSFVAGVYTPNKLILKPAFGGTNLGSGRTHIPAGTANTISPTALGSALVANAGTYNLMLPLSTQIPTGLLRPFGVSPTTKAIQASVNRQMTPNLELFADFSYNDNRSDSVHNPMNTALTVPTTYAINPFTTQVRIVVPDGTAVPSTTRSTNRGFTVGLIAQLPRGWTGQADYSQSQNRFQFQNTQTDIVAFTADMLSGALNPFVDSQLYPLNVSRYLFPVSYGTASTLKDYALRGSGPLWALPWGTPNLTIGLEHRIAETADATQARNFRVTTVSSDVTTFFGRQAKTDSGYGELTIPLVKKDWLPIVHTLELQLSGRTERFTVDTGTPTSTFRPSTGVTTYGSPTLNGQRYYSKASYASTNGTVGLKYQPVPELTLRVSLASAFLPPTPGQLIKNPAVTVNGGFVDDDFVNTIGGGNPDLKPQSSKSFNAGIIWEPSASALKGLRLNAEYYRIEQRDAIGGLDAQTIVDQESTFPGRVTRDSSGTITLVDTSLLNLYKRDTEGWDLSADYTFKTGLGTFNLRAVESIILHLKNQYDRTLPEYDAVNFPNEAGAVKYKGNLTLSWERQGWAASWTARYFGSYKQAFTEGSPGAVQDGEVSDAYSRAQGGDTIPLQTYHDLFVSYAFGKQHAKEGSKVRALGASVLADLTVQVGVRNVFDKAPPFDVAYAATYYASPFGDMRLRSYWISVNKAF